MNLFTRYLNSAAHFNKPDDQGAIDPKEAARLERESIQVSEVRDNRNDVDNEKEENDEEEEQSSDAGSGDEENDKEDDKKEEETDEQRDARLAAEKEARKQARQQRKWDKLAAEKTAAENKVKELEAKLKENPVEGLTEEEVERRAEAKAAIKLAEKQQQDTQKQFEKNCDTLEAKALKVNKDFVTNLTEMVEEIGQVPGAVIEVLSDLDNENGGEVLNYLVNNIDEAEDIFDLKGNVKRLTMKLIRLSDKLKDSGKTNQNQTQRRAISNAPPPVKPVEGNSPNLISAPISGNEDMDTFVAKRERQIEQRRKNRGY